MNITSNSTELTCYDCCSCCTEDTIVEDEILGKCSTFLYVMVTVAPPFVTFLIFMVVCCSGCLFLALSFCNKSSKTPKFPWKGKKKSSNTTERISGLNSYSAVGLFMFEIYVILAKLILFSAMGIMRKNEAKGEMTESIVLFLVLSFIFTFMITAVQHAMSSHISDVQTFYGTKSRNYYETLKNAEEIFGRSSELLPMLEEENNNEQGGKKKYTLPFNGRGLFEDALIFMTIPYWFYFCAILDVLLILSGLIVEILAAAFYECDQDNQYLHMEFYIIGVLIVLSSCAFLALSLNVTFNVIRLIELIFWKIRKKGIRAKFYKKQKNDELCEAYSAEELVIKVAATVLREGTYYSTYNGVMMESLVDVDVGKSLKEVKFGYRTFVEVIWCIFGIVLNPSTKIVSTPQSTETSPKNGDDEESSSNTTTFDEEESLGDEKKKEEEEEEVELADENFNEILKSGHADEELEHIEDDEETKRGESGDGKELIHKEQGGEEKKEDE